MAAPQSLHIFQKDVRHLWPETLVTLLLFAAFAWSVPFGWHTSEYSQLVPLLAGLLHVLMPIAWLVVISRLIHDENLVGDRQFWTSRPYHWASLLGAKILYLVVFIYLPFFLMQVYLLKHAGLYPSTVIPALLHNLLLLTVVLIVPITAIAAVTSSFPRLLLSAIGAVLYILIAGGIFGYMLIKRMPPPHFTDILFALFIFLPAIALVYQYATRKTPASRLILLATPLVILVLLAITPATALIRGAYKVAASATDPKLTSIPLPASAQTPNGPLRTLRGDVFLTLPFTVQGVDDQSNYAIQGVAASFSNSSASWSSPYLTAFGSAISGSLPYTVVRLQMPESVFNKVRNTPIDLHLSLAADHLKASPASTWKSTLLPFSIPGKGVCFYPSRDSDEPAGDPVCRFPLHAPDVLFATASVAPSSCASPAGPPVPARGSLAGSPSFLDFDPVVLVPLTLATGDPEAQHHYELCPGTPISFLEAQPAGKARFEVDAKGITLDPYAVRVPTAAEAAPPPVTQIPQ